jgi:predicted transposase/invertase (TIGR01784 family)
MQKTLLNPMWDYVFKLIFGTRQTAHILAGFLKTVLELPDDEFDHLTIDNPILPRWFRKDKTGVLDVCVHTKSGIVIDVEVQIEYSPFMRNRVIYYHSKMHWEQLKSGDNYGKMRPAVNIVICGHLMLPEETAYMNSYSLRNDLTYNQFTDLSRMIILEIPKLPPEDDRTALWPWLRFFSCETKEELEMLTKEHPEVKEAAAKLRKISFGERWRHTLFLLDKQRRDQQMWKQVARDQGLAEGRAVGLAEGRSEGLAEGRSEGLTEGRVEIARKMKLSGLPVEQITAFTGLSPEAIRELAQK